MLYPEEYDWYRLRPPLGAEPQYDNGELHRTRSEKKKKENERLQALWIQFLKEHPDFEYGPSERMSLGAKYVDALEELPEDAAYGIINEDEILDTIDKGESVSDKSWFGIIGYLPPERCIIQTSCDLELGAIDRATRAKIRKLSKAGDRKVRPDHEQGRRSSKRPKDRDGGSDREEARKQSLWDAMGSEHRQKIKAKVMRWVDSLPEPDRTIMRLSYSGYTQRKIASEVGGADTTIGRHIRKRLQELDLYIKQNQ